MHPRKEEINGKRKNTTDHLSGNCTFLSLVLCWDFCLVVFRPFLGFLPFWLLPFLNRSSVHACLPLLPSIPFPSFFAKNRLLSPCPPLPLPLCSAEAKRVSRIARITRRNGVQSKQADFGRRPVRKEMQGWIPLTLAAAVVVVVLAIIVVAVFAWLRRGGSKESGGSEQLVTRANAARTRTAESLQDGIVKLHQTSLHHQLDREGRRRPSYYAFRRGASTRPLFNWSDHPSLITDAVESGWSRFAFAGYKSSPSTRSMLLGVCATGDHRSGIEPEISWEVCQGSADFMQKIRLNPGLLKKISLSNNNPMTASSVIKTALPLPGPPLGNSSFPQEAYFEITILYSRSDIRDTCKSQEGERTKLIHDSSNLNANSESLAHVTSNGHGNNYKVEELKLNIRDGGKGEAVEVSLGLTAGGSLPLKLPGSYPGSIGFNSNGSVFLDGIKLVFESEKAEWGRTEKVIGCGFDPLQKKVFFTVDSELMHVIHCKTEEYGAPLYPTLAANSDVMVLVNFGQAAFRYGPANAQRTSNPCFIGPLTNSPAAALGYEDSKELFSMGRIDSQWLNQFMSRGSHNHGNNNSRVRDFDDESEADLFEITLDSSGRSPNTVL
ncbi:hypothetical protein BT93_I0539 [Corymbia citriodora subsp. variegata]|nr:hypothetical protein BT93_I0539 [Corymbia citriodora subsp. variegata]